jgi:mRNA interferase MazF
MAIKIHPGLGAIVICDFAGLNEPEMTKRRLAVIVTPFIRVRPMLCTVVPLSTTAPLPRRDYNCELQVDPPLPAPYDSPLQWVKGDMVYTVSLDRISLPFSGKLENGKRVYDVRILTQDELTRVRRCMLFGLGIPQLTKHL